MTRRRSAGPATVLFTALGLLGLSSCATFNRNDVAARVGNQTISAADLHTLAAANGESPVGDQLRYQLTTWVRASALETFTGTAAPGGPLTAEQITARTQKAMGLIDGARGKDLYESGFHGSPVICLAAIPVGNTDDATTVMAALGSGTPFADVARQYSTDATLASNGGVVTDQDGNECLSTATVSPTVAETLSELPLGTPAVVDLVTLTAVVALRPFAALQPASQQLAAAQAITADASVYIDPRYGRWDPASVSVVPLSS